MNIRRFCRLKMTSSACVRMVLTNIQRFSANHPHAKSWKFFISIWLLKLILYGKKESDNHKEIKKSTQSIDGVRTIFGWHKIWSFFSSSFPIGKEQEKCITKHQAGNNCLLIVWYDYYFNRFKRIGPELIEQHITQCF